MPVYGTPRAVTDLQPVTIILCAKNEAANLQQNLPAILAQRYSNVNYEVIVVNDASTDDTGRVLQELQQVHRHLKVITVLANEQRTLPGKKYALQKALAIAAHELLLLTDADCRPAGDSWLQQMVAPLQAGKHIVAGYGKYTAVPGMLNAFIRWETLHTFVQYTGYALSGRPYMAVGRNLACTRVSMLNAQASPVWAAVPSGDDDLMVRNAGAGGNMAIIANPGSFTVSSPKRHWGEWLKQKQRHMSTGKYYRDSVKLLLGIYGLSHALLWITFFILLFTTEWQTALIAMACRCIIYWVLWYHTALRLDEKGLVKWFPLLDIGWMLYNFVLSPYIFWKNKKLWT